MPHRSPNWTKAGNPRIHQSVILRDDYSYLVPHVLFRGKESPSRVIGLPLTDHGLHIPPNFSYCQIIGTPPMPPHAGVLGVGVGFLP